MVNWLTNVIDHASRLNMRDRADRGRRAEHLAKRYLEKNGYKIIERNVRYPVGEIDLIGIEDRVLCFIEVRSKSSTEWGSPQDSITSAKQQRIIKAARWYLQSRKIGYSEMRFDVVAIIWKSENQPSVELIRAAFNADDIV